MSRYIFRIDDVHPGMDWELFGRLKSIFNRFGVKPLIAVIPDNKDDSLEKSNKNSNFWQLVGDLKKEGWDIAMHGYQHQYINKEDGVLGLHKGSEFAGLTYEEQFEKLRVGKEIMEEKGLPAKIFIAPGHSFDKNTVLALKKLGFLYISDGFRLYPFKKWGMIWVPQILATPRVLPLGIITFCLHPQSMNDKDFSRLEKFLGENNDKITTLNQTIESYSNRNKLSFLIYPILNVFTTILLKFARIIKRRIKR